MSAIGLPMDGHVNPHFVRSGPMIALCQCPCDECTTRLTKQCVCLDCPCDDDEEHRQ